MSPKPEELVISEKSNSVNADGFVNIAYENENSEKVDNKLAVIENKFGLKAIEETGNNSSNMDFDDLLPLLGEFGRYQKILFLLMIPFACSVAFVYFTQIFITLVPESHWCRVPELEHLPVDER